MRSLTIFLAALVFFLFSCSRSPEITERQKNGKIETAESQYKEELEDIKKNLKGEVKIKLKRDGKGSYTWEIAGKDAQEILKVNETLRKKLSASSPE